MILEGKNIVLGVTGGIACYKAIDLCSKLVQAGAGVDVIMTEAATHFVTPLPFQTLTKRPVALDPFLLLRDVDMAHISLSAKADLLIIAPATANTIAKVAHGLADNLLTSTAGEHGAAGAGSRHGCGHVGAPGYAGQCSDLARARGGHCGARRGQAGLGAHGPWAFAGH